MTREQSKAIADVDLVAHDRGHGRRVKSGALMSTSGNARRIGFEPGLSAILSLFLTLETPAKRRENQIPAAS